MFDNVYLIVQYNMHIYTVPEATSICWHKSLWTAHYPT